MEMNEEMSEMRNQIALLKRRLDGEKLVNGQLVRSIISHKVATIRRDNVCQMAVAVVMIPFCGIILTQLTDCSLVFIIVTELLFTAALLLQWYVNRGISVTTVTDGSLVETGHWLARLKRFTLQQRWLGLPLVCLWLFWFYVEVMKDKVIPLQYVALSGATVIVCIVWNVCHERKQHREIDEIMSQINELTREL